MSKIGNGLGLTWSVAWDGSAIWCATLTGKVYKLNPVSGAVIKQFNSPGSQPWGMTFDGTCLWLVDFAEKRISKIDTATGAELKTFSTPDSAGGCKGVAWDGTYLNILGWTSPVIYRVDTTGTVAGTIYLQQGGGGGIAWDGTYFWVAGRSIQKYDLNGNAVGWIYPCSEGTWDMDWDGSRLWITQRTNENWRDAKIYRVEVLDDHSPPVSMYVKMGGNDLMDGLSGGQAKQHIQSAIDAAPENAIVRVAEGIYDENIILAGRTLTVEGGYDSVDWAQDVDLHPAVVTGGGRGPVVRITGGMVTLGQLELRNGYADIDGGAGLTLTGGVTDVRGCVITQNVAVGQNEWGAGGMTLLDGVLTMSGCRVIDNATSGGAGGLRIGSGGRFTVSGTLIAGNTGRPAVHTNDASGSFINCTVTDNPSGGLLYATPSPSDTILNCILWRNGPHDVAGYVPAVSFTDAEQELVGPGNISSDPLFVNREGRDYRLRLDSPCIDSGDPASPHDPDATRADMGAYFYDHRVVGVDRSHDEEASADFSLAQNYPNPSNPATTIRYTVGDTRHVQLSVYDMLGREVATLVNEKKEPGKYEVPFDVSTMASGVYFYRLQAGGLVVTKKLVVLR